MAQIRRSRVPTTPPMYPGITLTGTGAPGMGQPQHPPPNTTGNIGYPNTGYPNVPQTGLIGSEQALRGGLQGALGALQQGIGMGRGDVRSLLGRGAGALNPFVQPGQMAQQRQAALSGALGADAQAQAMQAFMDSPQQAFLREQGERAVTRNAAALGGLGGGNVMKELSRFGTGLAAQDFENQFNRLGQVAGQGLTAAQSLGGLWGQGAGIMGNIGLQGGLTAADLFRGTGQDLATGRTVAGQQIAGAISGTSSNLADLINQQGSGMRDIYGTQGGNLAKLLAGFGDTLGGDYSNLAQMLANSYLTQGGQYAGLPGLGGATQNQGNIGQWGQLAAGIGTAIEAWR